ncbi:MAG: Uma2 family endonuclease [Aggregatilineales bacterium]
MADQTMMPSVSPTSDKINFEAFLHLYDGQYAELVDGEVIVLMPPSTAHQILVNWLSTLIFLYLGYRPVGTVLHAPYPMKILGRAHGREPDILFVSTAHEDRIKDNHLDGPADLVVEVVSPESDERDHGTKFTEYEAAGIPEYWLIDLIRHELLAYALGSDKRYHAVWPDAKGDIHSITITDFRLHVAMLWQDPSPNGMQIIEYVQKMIESK